MQTPPSIQLCTPGEFLAEEEHSPFKREYIGGLIYPWTSDGERHDRIAINIVDGFRGLLRSGQYWPFSSDTKLRIRLREHTRFYYPDAFVVAHPNPSSDLYQDEAVLIAEVMSKNTQRVDEGEKKDAYLWIPSLETYLLVSQDYCLVIGYRRTNFGFVREVFAGTGATIPVPKLGISIPLGMVYAKVSFDPVTSSDKY